ncbi:Na+/H+ antiporter NhaA [Pseudomonas amygdali]|uniref:Na+/H+ antiporter NhaA n=3 Tax=Pseudomonas amygdali TaxID=47877 RepID=UPI0001CC3AAA|nr:Na+/H+ antiporter NhaA [Pseudomonas amygdali]KWT03276.1 sodium:proton antiporter [Pseudomonas amygdali pv. aesculi]KWT26576.1 sodium:proton antiporter [Pseudomonas amygdali pv. aesculi]KWT26721.1 sodium:proton antiporter [Pseudomonas amygdali pv. aesculi]KWT27432.1 sodium:proton antiporter [Pseudomonas amygdali pv. aesculi]KWT31191.1 sodium:proton antiporter [Pseudomonas amygdali pv. aesculi]
MHNPTPRTESPSALAFIKRFFAAEAAGGLILMAAALAALIVANSPLADSYFAALHTVLAGMSVAHWINDGLMAIFFMLVGLEIKREMLAGQLASWSQRALPGFAALGGMVVPALIYVAFNWGQPDTIGGWAIPAATDIAFALGVLSLLGKRVPLSLKIFLSALAILDDLGAVLIIALFYTSDLSIPMLLAALGSIAVLVALNRLGVKKLLPYLIVGALLWFFMLQSGIHATLAGVALALCIPLGKPAEEASSPLLHLEEKLHPWVAFAVVPVFGFANAGVSLSGITADKLLGPVPLGVALGLLIGKQVGIFALAALAIRAGLARLPDGSNWGQLYGVAALCGIGFTMSLFIGALAFPGAPELVYEVKVGVLIGSVLSALLGVVVLRRFGARG